jgi:hypothetical protein
MTERFPALRTIILIWLAWAVIILGFQWLIDERLVINRPDRALSWTPNETARNSQNDKPYLLESYLNRQVSWDSEFYLSIATYGYDDPDVRIVTIPDREEGLSMNYAFFPLYPYIMKVVRVPLEPITPSPIAASALAGVLVSLVGTLFGMLALYDITRDELEHNGALRAVFYLLIFPTAFFLAMVYTEGLFIGLAFGCLALCRRKQLIGAAVLAFLATLTRATGGLLIVPLGLAWLNMIGVGDMRVSREGISGWDAIRIDARSAAMALLVLAPLLAYGLWTLALGEEFHLVEEYWFGRGLFDWDKFKEGVEFAWDAVHDSGNTQMRLYYIMEFAAVVLAVVACLATLKRYPGVALFGLLLIVVSATSGAPQSLFRYMLVVPSIYILLGRLGRNIVFDRAWTIASVLLLGMQAMLFGFDMWVA